jgi:HAE1 family hydrophobic/amphiphilic exporter-1
MSSDIFFVRRPTLAIVIAIVSVILGLVALIRLPISQYPEVVPPEIVVNSVYNGADSVSVEQSVTTPLEQKINGVDNMIYVRSINANDGTSAIRISFEVGSDMDMSNVLVQNRVSEALPTLPEDVKRLGVTVKKSLSFPLVLVTLRSPNSTYDSNFLSNYASININDSLSRIPGIGQLTLFGGSDYAMRLWVSPQKLANLGITVGDIVKAVQSQNVIAPGGQIGGPPAPENVDSTYNVKLSSRYTKPEEFENIIVKSNEDGSMVRIKDIVRVELGAQNYNAIGRYNSQAAAVIALYQVPGSNALSVVKQINARMEELSKNFPDDLEYQISLDTSESITAGIDEIVSTLIEAIVLVILVVFIFLQSFRATIIPTVTIPVALLGTFAVFPFLGFSVNSLSLLGLVLAIGTVVDDAIVVVEAVMQHIEKGLSPREATNKAMQEVTGPIIATTLILVAVFIPVIFIEGITGRFYSQFAVTIAVSVIISSINALTLSPALCSLLLKPVHQSTGPLAGFYSKFNLGFTKFTNRYLKVASYFGRKLILTSIVYILILVVTSLSGLYLPSSFVPEEDQGYILANLQLPNNAALSKTDQTAKKVESIIQSIDGVQGVTTVTGFSLITQSFSSNNAFFFIALKPWQDRPDSTAPQILEKINKKLFNEVTDATAFAFGPPAIPGIGTGSGFSMMLQDRAGNNPKYLAEQTQQFIEAAQKRPEIGRISTAFRAAVPQVEILVDREKAYKQGISFTEANQALGSFLGGSYINDFNRFGRLYKVYVQADQAERDSIDDLRLYHVRSSDQTMVPLGGLITTNKITGPEYTNRFNLYRSAELIGVPAHGFTTDDAHKALKEVAEQVLPSEMSYAWNAMSYQEINSSGSAVVFIFGMLFVFLILAAQYESWMLPFSVLLGTPFAVLGAFGGLYISREFLGESYVNNIFAQIGVLTLVGLAAKNAILIVEFARLKTQAGQSAYEAAIEAAKSRFRPILMTSFAFILGVMPLLVATGAGAEGRKVIGMSVFGGMLVATIVGAILVPALFVFIEKISFRANNE